MANMRFRYIFDYGQKEGGEKIFNIELDEKTLNYIAHNDQNVHEKEWIKLSFNQCEHCPLDPKKNEYCPIAYNLGDLIEEFKNAISYSELKITVETEDRTYCKETSLQEGLNSIFGVIMATSSCPIMDFLKPMARFHLPFATIEETIFRSISTYILGEYFAKEKYKDHEINLNTLEKKYENVQILNRNFAERLFEITKGMGDAERNAVTLLNMFAQMINIEIKNNISGLRYLFENEYENAD